jgi:DNA-directed RNA polymerase subunit RPC12/RpoP
MTPTDVPPASRKKATLFCPDCGREGDAIEGWRERCDRVTGVRRLHCPACGSRVDSRPLDPGVVSPVIGASGTARWTADD